MRRNAKALQTLELIHQKIALVDNVVELNALTVELGDKFYARQQFKEALACYRSAYPLEQFVRLQNDRIAGMQRRIEENLATARANPAEITQLAALNNQLKEGVANAQKLVAEFEKLPTITPAIYLRLGRCFYELDRKWEAIVVDQEILDRFKDPPEREPALFGVIVGLADVNQPQRAEERCEEYLRDFKSGPNAATVGYLLGAVALQVGDPKAADTYFGRILETQAKSKFREQICYLLGNAKFMEGNYDDAVAAYKNTSPSFRKARAPRDVKYRIALSALFAASRLLQKQSDWSKMSELFSGFVKDKPDKPTVVSALYWIGKAKAHEGKIEEAKQLAADTIKKCIDDPNRDAVEQLITQLAQLCVKKKKSADEESATPVAPEMDPDVELDRLLSTSGANDSPTAKARIVFAKAGLARFQPAEEEKYLVQITSDFKPEDLSQLLLGEAGDYLVSKEKVEQAAGFYQRLINDFPESQMVDFACNGLGEIAYQEKDYSKALKYFSDASTRSQRRKS